MASQGATLQSYNNDLVKMLEGMKEKREEVHAQVVKQEQEKLKLEEELGLIQEKLNQLNQSIGVKIKTREEYDKTIKETESAYLKILESSQTLLHVMKREDASLKKKVEAIEKIPTPN